MYFFRVKADDFITFDLNGKLHKGNIMTHVKLSVNFNGTLRDVD